ncbi:probably inactive leucine-rich repeat receptor-like protein kinase At5g48380 [Populus alba]|nr:probably inactive leucine-rich repeat receptor-like protein kinase At5g48380 [Populus alba]
MNSQIQMANLFFIYSLMLSLLATFTVTSATDTDVYCLKSIKDFMIDPYGYFNTTWDFNNNTEGFICRFRGVECWHPDENRVLNLALSNMGLKGQFPPGIENCTSLIGLDLSRNELQGPIPSDIYKRLPYITYLDLSYNSFSGEIPSSIANLSLLNVLKLDHNQLKGNIPPQIGLLPRLRNFSVADNLLSGPVPEFVNANSTCGVFCPIGGFSSSINVNYANNPGLCGGPLDPCKGHSNEFYSSFRTGFAAGYTVFSVSVIVGFLSCCAPWVHVKKRNKKITIQTMVMLILRKNRKEADNLSSSPSFENIQGGGKEISMLEKKVPRMSYSDLKDATNNFSENNVIGQGKIGMLYKAALPSGYLFAVKKLHNCRILEEHFVFELKTLGSLRHVNLLQLLGFSITSKHWLLVYKYMPNGNLYDWLHPMEGQAKIMEWTVRFKVAIGLARGLSWLHQDCSSTIRVYHLNISSKCILLDQDFEPKLSNFGEAIIVNPTTTSPLNGEFWDTAFAKEDVYGFGVVLLELITGVDSSRMTGSSNSLLNEWISHLLTSSKIYDAIDKSLVGQGFDDEIFQLLKVACNCVDSIPDRRPTMHQVYKDIRAMRERCGQIDDSEILVQHHDIYPPSSKGKSVEIEMA